MLRSAIIWMLSAATAEAGAWARAEGDVFLSFGGNAALFGDAVAPVYYDPTVYLEYGLTPRLTVGFDGYTADRGKAGSLFVFGRYALDDGTGPNRFAASLSAGYTLLPTGALSEAARIGLHWGRGLERGWVAVDATATAAAQTETQYKIDTTWGHAFGETTTGVLNFEVGYGLTGDFYAKVTPTVVAEVNSVLSVRVGLVRALTGDHGGGLLVQSWVEF